MRPLCLQQRSPARPFVPCSRPPRSTGPCTAPWGSEQPSVGACRRRQQRLQAASSSGGEGDGESVDIDALAARLSAEAEKLRKAGGMAGGAAEEPAARRGDGTSRLGGMQPFGYETKAAEAEILASVGEGGLLPEEFELMQELGTINIQQIATTIDYEESPLPTSERSARTAIIAYTASFFTGMPFQDPVVTLVKEYLPGAKAVACNELQVLKHLAGMPELTMKWQVAAAPLASYPPIVRLLGYFLAGQTQKAQELLPGQEEPEDAIWVVLKWEGLAPLALYPSAQQTSGIGLGRLFGGQDSSLKDRRRMLRAITRGALQALAYVHEAGVVHGALGSGSVMLSSFDDRSAQRVVVKLDNFGFSRKITVEGQRRERGGTIRGTQDVPNQQPAPLATADTPLGTGQREDLQALAVVLLECILSALAASGPSQITTADSIQRLLGEVFLWGVADFRQYCEDEPDWQAAVELLGADNGAGWDLLEALVVGSASAAELAGGRFCKL